MKYANEHLASGRHIRQPPKHMLCQVHNLYLKYLLFCYCNPIVNAYGVT